MVSEDFARRGRIRLIDIAKGGGIIGVVFAHASANVFSGSSGTSNPLIQFFYSFLLMFFLLSGYVYRPGRTPKENIIRIAKRMIPLFLICSIGLTFLMWIILLIMGYNVPFEDFLGTVSCTLIGRLTFTPIERHDTMVYGGLCNISFAYYYIVFLFFASIIFYLIVDKVSNSLKKTSIAVLILVICEFILLSILPVHLPYCIEGCLVPAALMIIGAYISQKHVFEDIEVNFLKPRRLAILAIMTVIGILSATFIPLTVGLSSAKFGNYGAWSALLCLITVLSCGYVIMTLCAIVERIPIFSKIFEYCGKHSLSILMLHGFYIRIIAALFYTIPEEAVIIPLKTIPEAVAVSIASIILCLLTSFALRYMFGFIKERTKKEVPTKTENSA